MNVTTTIIHACLSLVLLCACTGAAAQEAWQLNKSASRDGVTVHMRKVEDSGIKEFKGEVVLTTSLASVVAAFNDVQATTNWLYHCVESATEENISFNERYVYHVIDLPILPRHRDYVLHAQMSTIENGIEISLRSAPDKKAETDYIRILKNTGLYRAEVLDENLVKLTWIQHIEPEVNMINWMVNNLIKDIPYESLRDFRTLVQQEKYQNAELLYGEDGNIVGLQ